MPHRRYEVTLRVVIFIVPILGYQVSTPDQIFEEKYLFWSIEGTFYVSGFHMTFIETLTEDGPEIR
jgi:hypothetical protein